MSPAFSDLARIHSDHPMKRSSYPFRRFTAKSLSLKPYRSPRMGAEGRSQGRQPLDVSK